MGVLVERDDALRAVGAVLDDARRGTGGAVLLRGPAGVGKSALLRRALQDADGLQVLHARAADLERDFALGVVRQLLEPPLRRADASARTRWLAGPAAPAGPVLGAGEAPAGADAQGLRHALHWLVAAMAADAPLLLAVDDLHWADEASLRWLVHLARRVADLPVALLLTSRPADPAAPMALLRALGAEPDVRVLELEALSPDGTAAVVAGTLGPAAAAFAGTVHDLSGGTPLLVDGLLRAARDDGVAPDGEGAARLRAIAPRSVREAVARRLDALGEEAAAVATALAVLGDGARLADVAALAPATQAGGDLAPRDHASPHATTTAAAIAALTAADVLADDARLAFRHALLRDAVLDGLAPGTRALLHRRAAAVLEAAGAPAEQVAAQLLEAEPAGEPWAVDALRRAAATATARGAPGTAAALLRRALAEDPGATALLVPLSAALLTAGDPSGLEPLLAARAGLTDPAARCAQAFRGAMPLGMMGRGAEAAALVEEALQEAGAGATAWRFALATTAALTASLAGGDVRGATARALALLPPEDAPLTPEERSSLGLLAATVLLDGAPADEVRALAWRSIGDEDALRRSSEAGYPLPGALAALSLLDGAAAVDGLWAVAEEAVRTRGALGIGLPVVLGWRAVAAVAAGRLAVAEAALDVVERHVSPAFPLAASQTWAAGAVALVELGRPDEAAAALDRAPPAAWEHGVPGATLHLARSAVALACRDPAAARAAATRAGEVLAAAGTTGAAFAPWRLAQARALLALGERDAAQEAAARAAEDAAAVPHAAAAARVVGALAAADLEALAAATAALAGSPAPLEHARALTELGAALRRRGDRAAAREPLRDALDLAARLGAAAVRDRAHEELLAAGARPRSVVRTGVDALTASELRSARLAATGLTNRQIAEHLFVTPKTVESQLRAAYRKLGVPGRAALADALAGA